MKILIVNLDDIQGGAARAAHRLHNSLLNAGIESQMLVLTKKSDESTIITPIRIKKLQTLHSLFRQNLEKPWRYLYPNWNKTEFSISWVPFGGLINAIQKIDPDIVHLHWICGGMIRIEDLKKIKKPIVWSLHDMWAFTGGCHYDGGCGKYATSCGSCPILGSNKEQDLSSRVFSRKIQIYSQLENFTIIGLSTWISECASQSRLLNKYKILNIPNPINASEFSPVNKSIARKSLGIADNKKIILFGAMFATEDKRKGYHELINALKLLKYKENIELVIFGGKKKGIDNFNGFLTHYLGYINEKDIPNFYSAADVMVVPSLQENLSNTIMEALSCGTPVVCFNIGGNPDMIDHQHNGYLASPYNPKDLANGIEFVINSTEYEILCLNARNKVLQCFDSTIVGKRYLDLYNHILYKSKE